jgi:hypothetical protein
VYVVPADRDVEIADHTVRLHTDAMRRTKPSIDLLLSSAARAYGERLIAVILTGAGSDGAAGAREVKLAGGTVIIPHLSCWARLVQTEPPEGGLAMTRVRPATPTVAYLDQ